MYVSIVFRETTKSENYLREASKTVNAILQVKVTFVFPHVYVVTCNNNIILIVRINIVSVYVCVFVCLCGCGCGCGMSMCVCVCLLVVKCYWTATYEVPLNTFYLNL